MSSINKKYLAKTLAGLEEVLANELLDLGMEQVEIGKRAVSFETNLEGLYKINYKSRLALRFLMPLFSFKATNEDQLYKHIFSYDWSKHFDLESSFAVDPVVHSTIFRHSKYVALKTKDAIADHFRKHTGLRPNVKVHRPDVMINIHINENQCTVSLDSSGDSLHRRGYHEEALEAPISEILAAGMIRLSNWNGENDFYDPMCGSGTIICEAYLMARNLPPQLKREYFGFLGWKNFDAELWEKVKQNALQEQRNMVCNIFASDKDFKAVRMTERNLSRIEENAATLVHVERKDFFKSSPSSKNAVLVTNPPYGERLSAGEQDDTVLFYQNLADHLKSNYSGFYVWIISSALEAMKQFGLKATKKYLLFNGKLECFYRGYELYEGSRRKE